MQLVAHNVGVRRGMRTIVRSLSFRIDAGSALVLRGANGAGKTTLIRAIAGFLPLHSGTIAFEGLPKTASEGAESESLSEQCHYIGHRNGTRSLLTVRENVRFWGQYLSHDETGSDRAALSAREDHATRALEAFQLAELADTPAKYLSAGQNRRLGLARLVAASRKVWLLDEPTVSLDAVSVDLLRVAVGDHLASGGIVIAATHIPLGFAEAKELELAPVRDAFNFDEMAL